MWKKLAVATNVALLLLLVCGLAGEGWAQETRYAATLSASTGSSGSGRADFSFDDLGRQLTYTIVYDAMPGNVLSAYIAGPRQSDIAMELAPPQSAVPAPIVGTVTLSEPEAGLLKTSKLFVGVRSSANGDIGGWIMPR